MKPWHSIRGRVAALATLAVVAVLAAVGAVVVATFAEREHERLDERLAEPTPPRLAGLLAREHHRLAGLLAREHHPGEPADAHGPGGPPPGAEGSPELGGRALRPEGEFVRLTDGERTVAAVDAPAGLPAPSGPGFRTVEAGGTAYRTAVRPTPSGDFLEVGAELTGLRERVASLRTRVIVVSLVGTAVTAALAWWLAGLALRPLARLRSAVARVSSTRDLSTRIPGDGDLVEVDALSASVNAMLARLEASAAATDRALEATRRFAADAGHELRTPMTALRANLGALLRNPRLGTTERRALLGEAEAEVARTVSLLEALQTLARGEAGASLPRQELDLADTVDAALERARRRHPHTAFELRAPQGDATLDGWPDGLELLVDNLIENGARHGRRGGRVDVTIERTQDRLTLIVDDDGPGIPSADRERVFERFVRGREGGDGSGLGLALVRQQARLHGGEAWAEQSPHLGGARLVVRVGSGTGRAAPSRGPTRDGQRA